MTGLYIVTGFLGAGKTTFVKQLLKVYANKKIGLIVNEFGKEGIDSTFFGEMKTYLSEINNGSIFCACRAGEFEKALIETIDKEPDVILVETSGLSDPLSFKNDNLNGKGFTDIDLCGIICVADAVNFKKVISTALPSKNQMISADLVILNKVDMVNDEELETTISLINSINPGVKIIETTFGNITKENADLIRNLKSNTDLAASSNDEYQKKQKYLLTIKPNIDLQLLKTFINDISQQANRIKGFIKADNSVFYVDVVEDLININAVDQIEEEKLQKLVVLSYGNKKTLEAINNAQDRFGVIKCIEE